jgi:hypothetical protein
LLLVRKIDSIYGLGACLGFLVYDISNLMALEWSVDVGVGRETLTDEVNILAMSSSQKWMLELTRMIP